MVTDAIKDLYLREKFTKDHRFCNTDNPQSVEDLLTIIRKPYAIVSITKDFKFVEINSFTKWFKYVGVSDDNF